MKNKYPILLFESEDYSIEKIHLNYRINIKCEKKNIRQGMERDWYSMDEFGLEGAHETANQTIDEFFNRGVKPKKPIGF